jgi:hypothetical protein
MLSHAGDNAAESCWRWCYRGDKAAARCRCWVMLVTMLPSHASNSATEVTWPQRDVDVESCWWWHWRGDSAAVQCRCWVMLAIVLPSYAGNDAARVTWPWHDVDAKSCWRQCCRVMLAMMLLGEVAAVRCRCWVMLATTPMSHAGDGSAPQGCTGCGKVVQPPRLKHRGVVAS